MGLTPSPGWLPKGLDCVNATCVFSSSGAPVICLEGRVADLVQQKEEIVVTQRN